ncbi:MAG: NAD(P)-dependent oxidoreductase, partial [Haliea sp.]
MSAALSAAGPPQGATAPSGGSDPHAVGERGGNASTVGVIGVGNMGGGMARRLLSQGWRVQVCDIDPARTLALEAFGASVHATPALTAMNTVATIVCVVDAAQADAVL